MIRNRLLRGTGTVVATGLAVFLLLVVLSMARDAHRGIVTVYSRTHGGEALSRSKFRAVLEAQAVVEQRMTLGPSSRTVSTLGFDSCTVFSRKNWRCERSGIRYLMHDGQLSIQGQGREKALPEVMMGGRLHWWEHRLSSIFDGR